MIIVIDYNVGNVKSVCNAFEFIGCDVRLSADPDEINSAQGLVLPGVAAFGYAMQALGNLADVVKTQANIGIPLLGICVGYQLLFQESCEHGTHAGLGLIKGKVTRLPETEVIPHMGWNEVQMPPQIDLLANLGEKKHFYFAHSYFSLVEDNEATFAYTDYGFELPAAVQKKNVYGTQFHPEKSGRTGLALLQNFADICYGKR